MAALATCGASAAKAVWETDRSRRCGVRSSSGRFTGWCPVHWGIGGHGGLLRLDIFHKLADRAHRHRLQADATALQGVSGTSLDVRGLTEIKIQGVTEPVQVSVLGDLPCKMVLGEDALQDGQGIINFSRNVLRWHRREWPMRRIEHAFKASLGQVLPETGYEQINQLIQKNADLFSAKGEPNGFCSNSSIHIKTNHPPQVRPLIAHHCQNNRRRL